MRDYVEFAENAARVRKHKEAEASAIAEVLKASIALIRAEVLDGLMQWHCKHGFEVRVDNGTVLVSFRGRLYAKVSFRMNTMDCEYRPCVNASTLYGSIEDRCSVDQFLVELSLVMSKEL